MLHLAAQAARRLRVSDSSGEGAAAVGGIRSPGRGGAGTLGGRCGSRPAASGFKLALAGTDEPRVPRRAAAIAARVPDGVPAALEAVRGSGKRVGFGGGAGIGVSHSGPTDRGAA